MDNYETTNAPQSFGWAPYHDDTCYYNPTFTGYEQLSENSTTQGSWTQVGSGVYWEQIAQYELMGGSMGPPIMPYWDFTGYSPTLSTDYNTVAEPGVGLNNWYSFLDAYPTSGSPLQSSNAMTYGMRSVTEDECNVVSYSTFYDVQVVGEIYDTLAAGNASNPSQLLPYIATGWTTTTWANPGTGKPDSNITINLRNNVEWQDVPGPENRAKFTTNDGNELNGPLTDRYLTPLDEAFTLEYGAVGWAYDITYEITTGMYVDHVDVSTANSLLWNSSMWAINATQDGYAWQNMTAIENYLGITPSTPFWPYYQATTPGPGYPGYYTTQYMQGFVRANSKLNSTQIQVYMSADWPWQTQYYVLGQYVVPMDVFSHLAINPMGWTITTPTVNSGKTWTPRDECTMDLEPYAYNSGTGADLLYGSGPYVLVDDAAAVPTTNFRLDAYVKGLSYGGITLDHSYFLYGKAPTTLLPQTGTAAATSTTLGSGLSLTLSQTLLNHNSTANAVGTYSWEYKLYDPDHVNITNEIPVPGGTFNLNKYGLTNDSYTFTKTLALTHYGDPLEVVWGMVYTVTSGVASVYLNIPSTVSHTNIFTFNQGFVGLLNGWTLTFNQTLVNPGSATPISYYWNYKVEMFNATDSKYDIPIATGSTPTVNGYAVPTGTSAITGAVVLDNNTVTDFDLEVLWSFVWNSSVLGPLYQIDYGLPTPINVINTNSYSYGFTPGDISQYTVSLAASWTGTFGNLPTAYTPTINYGWTITLMEWNGVNAYSISIASSVVTGSFALTSAGYSISPTVLLNLPPSWGASPYVAPPWGNWLNLTVTFQWTYGTPAAQHNTYVTPSNTVFAWAPGDTNNDGVANGLDLGILASAWLSTPGAPNWNPAADINNDGVVNGLDLGILAQYWLLSYAIPPPAPTGP